MMSDTNANNDRGIVLPFRPSTTKAGGRRPATSPATTVTEQEQQAILDFFAQSLPDINRMVAVTLLDQAWSSASRVAYMSGQINRDITFPLRATDLIVEVALELALRVSQAQLQNQDAGGAGVVSALAGWQTVRGFRLDESPDGPEVAPEETRRHHFRLQLLF